MGEGCKFGPKFSPFSQVWFKFVQNWNINYGFHHILKFAWLVFLDIAQDCSLWQCLTSSRAETSKKYCDSNRDRNDMLCSNVVGHPVKLAFFIKIYFHIYFFTKFACVNLSWKFYFVNLLNSVVVVYLSWFRVLSSIPLFF